MTLTPREIEREMAYRREERIAILCGVAEPELWVIVLAEQDAIEWRGRYERDQQPAQKELL